mgnify:FL=1
MNTTKATNRTISVSIYALLWFVLILLQTLVTSVQALDGESVFARPELYYSTWLTDLYLVGLFYLNYYFLAPRMMRRRLYRPYLWMLLVVALIGFLIPLLCYALWGLTMPGVVEGSAPLSSLGVVGAVAAIALGLAIRGLIEWDSLGQEVRALREERDSLTTERDRLKLELSTLRPADRRGEEPVVVSLQPSETEGGEATPDTHA